MIFTCLLAAFRPCWWSYFRPGDPERSEWEMSQKSDQSRIEKKEEQTKESGPSFDLNIRLGPKLDPNMPLHASSRRYAKY
eukprot:scaffold126870_cov35-Attheya_sp.AAC.1